MKKSRRVYTKDNQCDYSPFHKAGRLDEQEHQPAIIFTTAVTQGLGRTSSREV